MNEIIQQLIDRKSIRAFTDEDISEEDRQLILTAAVNAPTAGNQQLYTILNITDPIIKKQLADSCDHQPFIAKAPMILLFAADPLKWHDAFRYENCDPRRLEEEDLILAIDDALIAAQNAVTAAWSLGIGSCYIGDIMENREEQKRILNLPDNVFPAALLVFGYPTDQQKARKKPQRAELSDIVQENTYHRRSRSELSAMLENNFGEGSYQEHMKAFCNRKFNSDFSREMSRSVREYLDEYGSEMASNKC